MALRNFGTTQKRVVEQVAVSESVGVLRHSSRTDLLASEWDWRAMRDYVFSKMQELGIESPLDRVKSASVCKSFLNRHGAEHAQVVVRYLYEVAGGRWLDRPVTIASFTKSADPYVARVITERLAD